jgi:hypothetical protein
MNCNISEWFFGVSRALRTRYVRLLEDELARTREEVARERTENERLRAEAAAQIERERAISDRLRLENRALLNSLLGTAGVPPVEEPRPAPQGVALVRRPSWPQFAASREAHTPRR